MKKLTLFFGILLLVTSTIAQDCAAYIPWQVGKKITIANYDSKDKLTGTTVNEVLSITQLDNKTEVIIATENFNKKGESEGKGQLKYYCKGDVFEMDMTSLISPEQLASFKDLKLEFNTVNLKYPKMMTVGMSIEDGFIEVNMVNEGMKMVLMRMDVMNVRVDANESITVPAGTFLAYKVSSDLVSKTGFITVNMKSISWMVAGVGIVRTESYNKKGELISYSVVTKME
jgi:hypothetical protein